MSPLSRLLRGAYHQTQNGLAQKSQALAQQTPTQGHDRDMGTIQNTAALYLRKSSLDDRSGDNRSVPENPFVVGVWRFRAALPRPPTGWGDKLRP